VQHDNSRGPFKGGFRFHPDASMDDARRRAARPRAPPFLARRGDANSLAQQARVHDR